MEQQASNTKIANIVIMNNVITVQFSDDKGNTLELEKDRIEELKVEIEKIFTYFEVAKSIEEMKIEELERENIELKKKLGTITKEVGELWN